MKPPSWINLFNSAIRLSTSLKTSLLLATGENYVLPWQVAATEYLMFEGKKFSKSAGIGVWIDEALEILDADYWRFALILMRPEVRDTNFTWSEFYRIVNSDLNDDIGNFIHRTLTMVYRSFNGEIPEPGTYSEVDEEFIKKIKETPKVVGKYIEETRLKLAAQEVIELARYGNKYLNVKAPWEALKRNPNEAKTTLFIATNSIKTLAILLSPFMPKTAEKLWSMLNIEESIYEYGWEKAGE